MPFGSMIGLWALISIVPFIIMYLRRPKPKKEIIPSLMFLLKQRKVSKQYAFLRRLVQNLLFFLQLLIILAIAFAVARPYINLDHSITAENTVIVLDISASMQTKVGSTTRFQKAMGEANKYITGRVSMILAENTPLVVLEDRDQEIVRDILGKVRAKYTTTNLGDAMLLAKDILNGRPGRVVVLSDFGYSDGIDVLVAQRILTSNDIEVILFDVSSKASNVGIIDLKIDKYKTQVYVKNFNDQEETVTLSLAGKNSGKSEPMNILPNSIERFEFETSPGASTVSLDIKDDLSLDNKVYISTPETEKTNVLLVTDVPGNKIIPALGASGDINLEVKYFTPERSLLGNYDVIILNQFQYVPGTFEDLSYYVKNGGNFILSAQDNFDEMRFSDIDLIETGEVTQSSTQVCIDIFNQFTKYFEENRCFAAVSKYIRSTAKTNALVIMSTSDGNPLFAIKDIGKGKAVYYGIYDDFSDFWQLPSYPIFWDALISFLIEKKDLSEYNFKSGKIISVENPNVKTPSSTIKTGSLILDENGFYEFDGKKVAVNLLSEEESDVTKDEKFENEKSKFNVKSEERRKEFHLDFWLMVIAFVILSLELVYIKKRGDL